MILISLQEIVQIQITALQMPTVMDVLVIPNPQVGAMAMMMMILSLANCAVHVVAVKKLLLKDAAMMNLSMHGLLVAVHSKVKYHGL